jgi:hypothetical protein
MDWSYENEKVAQLETSVRPRLGIQEPRRGYYIQWWNAQQCLPKGIQSVWIENSSNVLEICLSTYNDIQKLLLVLEKRKYIHPCRQQILSEAIRLLQSMEYEKSSKENIIAGQLVRNFIEKIRWGYNIPFYSRTNGMHVHVQKEGRC